MKLRLLTFTALFQVLPASAQEFFLSVAPTASLPVYVLAYSIVYDWQVNVLYLSGRTTVPFDNETNFDNIDAFVTKLDLNGTRLWTRILGGVDVDYVEKILQDPVTSDLFMFGRTLSAVFDNQLNTGVWDSFIVRFAQNGTKVFTRLFGSSGTESTFDAYLDTPSQQCVISGQYNDIISITLNDINNGSLMKLLMFPVYGSARALVSALGGGSDCFATGYVPSSFDNQAVFGHYDIFLSKMNCFNGTRYWSRIWGNSSDDYGIDVQFDPNTKHVFVAGYTAGLSINGQSALGGADAFLICAMDNGTYLWTRQFGSTSNDFANSLFIYKATGAVYVVGSFSDSFGFVSAYSQNGTLLQQNAQNVASNLRDISFGDGEVAYVADLYGFLVKINAPSRLAVSAQSVTTAPDTIVTPAQAATTVISTNLLLGATSTSSLVPVLLSVTEDLLQISTSPSLNASRTSLATRPVASKLPIVNFTTQPWNVTYLISGIVGVLVLFVFVTVCCIICFRRKSGARHESTGVGASTSETTFDTTTQSQSTQMQPTTQTLTLMRTNFELSLPGYLQFQSQFSFRVRKSIARGGGGMVVAIADALIVPLSKFGPQIIVKAVASGAKLENLPTRQQKTFYQEIAIMHYFREEKHIAKLLGWSDSPASILMKLYPLGSLDRWIYGTSHKSKLYQLQFIHDISRGILAMHNAGFVHCDLKPANVLVDTDETGRLLCCITDFGITQVVDETSLLVKEFPVENVRGLSIPYAAPESFGHVNSSAVTAELVMKIDMYSLAITMFELLERRRPWRSRYRTS